ncbi:prefoldin beta subunit [Exophiala aquamarina CBS 119918]|uniref:Prefoldin beta subunit n=1 Tax=Exophiala aquamarina CBS 119918 TaxID=1182545 RepID=A0A072PU21_9EURO|nr:prefoldin beta subunit [Exophiala aquamarina CBS 119918]KEF62813.1 prefoldin beta subunit [Exophiala aquamarina CBS 119918]
MEEDRNKLQTLSEALQKFQDDLQSAIDARQTLEAQQQENKAVQNEFNSLAEDAGIYKLVGPVLLKQDKTDATAAVDGRLEFIGKEITRTEIRIKELQEGSEKKRIELLQLQQKLQLAAQEQSSG